MAGLGSASKQILPHIARFPEMQLTAGADTRPETVREFEEKYKGKGFSTVEAMCKSGEIDALWVATPNVNHAEHTVIAAENGKHIIVEKPMAVNLAEADQMIAAAKRNGVKLVQGHSKIYSPAIQKMREVILSGRLGRVIQINTWNSNDWLQRPRLASEVDTRIGGGIVFRQGPHQIDIVRYLGGGMVKSVRAVTGRSDKNFDTEGDYTAFLQFDDRTPATLAFNAYGHFDIAELTWGIGEGGRKRDPATFANSGNRYTGAVDMDIKYSNPRTTEESSTREREMQGFFGLTIVGCEKGVMRQSPQGVFVYTDTGVEEIVCGKDIGRSAELRELYRSVTQKRDPFPDGRWGKATLEVALAMLQSSKEDREIKLAHQVPSIEMHKLHALEEA
ncbi:MAG: phthalate 4,5-cis-dihydrodiol dehydrogenase [Alphaproteobacteria bacterium]|jgi:phthalate 4,5-cis-dihydrodiol dehydrogenase|nr:phthalate 4,5-cis-dihydrodiol dehydrogenase [Alphaproteobacteria bacterium]